jgi:hypothetical protein
VIGAVARRPRLWGAAARQAWRLAPKGWWRRRPFLPMPDPAYLRFRLETQYGDAGRSANAADVVAYLDWCRRFDAAARRRAGRYPAPSWGGPSS